MSDLVTFHSNIEKEFGKIGVQSKFTVTKESTIKSVKIVVNVSVFRMPDPYKDESLYINGLSMLMDNLDKYIKNCVLRIYYDDSVTKKDDKWRHIMDKALSKPFVQMVQYDFPQFKKDGSFYHEGVFGTIVRFFSLFNFSDVNEAVAIIDIDFLEIKDIVEVADIITRAVRIMKTTKTTFLYNTYSIMAYLRKPRLLMSDIIKKYDFTTRMVVQPTTCIKKMDTSIICDFMLCMLKKCPLYKNWIAGLINGLRCDNVPSHNVKRQHQCTHLKEIEKSKIAVFAFGVDELFLNTSILEEFLKNKKPFLLFYQMPNVTHYHFGLYRRFQNKKIPAKFMFEMYNAVLGRRLNSTVDIHKAFKEVDKIIYMNEGKGGVALQTEKAKKLYDKFYKFLKPRANQLLTLPNLEIYETMMFNYLKNTAEEDFVVGRYFYKVRYVSNNKYELVRYD